MNLKNKNVLIIAPRFYGYPEVIKEEIEGLGAGKVICINSNPGILLTNIVKKVRRANLIHDFLINSISEDKCLKKIRKIKNTFDYILVIYGWEVSGIVLKKIRTNYLKKDGKMILYYWDNRKNVADKEESLKYFDKIYSFDSDDCHQFNYTFLPLFFRNEYLNSFRDNIENKYDISMVASYNLFRYRIVENIKKCNKDKVINVCLFANKKILFLHKLLRKECRNVELDKLTSSALEPKQITDIYNSSYAILDLPHPKQSGLTIRTLECLAMEKKLVTTNVMVTKYDFYRPENIFVLKEDGVLPNVAWFHSDYEDIDETIINKYSINSWVQQILSL